MVTLDLAAPLCVKPRRVERYQLVESGPEFVVCSHDLRGCGRGRSANTCRLLGLTIQRLASRPRPPTGVARERSASPEVVALLVGTRFCSRFHGGALPKSVPADRVVIAVDPHKASWTAVIVDQQCQPLDSLRVEVNRAGYRRLRRFARDWPQAVWAIEGARGLGAPLAQKLADDGIECLDVPAKLAHRVRMLSTGHGRKNDEADALSVGSPRATAPDFERCTPTIRRRCCAHSPNTVTT
ncbi:transposase [Nocardia sp. NPDC005745]|uniref:IS110 family transposase n=1 Tax=Nocardia sp. NPDC005745 TaxID=3157061 RepID=UPI0033D5A8A7